jgi:arylamine N-acetyltransferase
MESYRKPMQDTETFPLDLSPHVDAVRMFLEYFRIPPKPASRSFLEEILRDFATLPYENISKIIRLHDNWDDLGKLRMPQQVIADHVAHRLGGTCFSLTYFLQAILTQHHFICYPVMADMRSGRNVHCAMIVLLDGVKYLVDPGYLLTQPMELNPDKPRHHRTEFAGVELRFDDVAQCYHLYTFNKDEMKWRYRFDDRPAPSVEFLQHWLASFGWNSMHGICLTKVTGSGLIYVRKTFMRETTLNGRRNINIKKNYHAAIHDVFGIEQQIIEQAEWALSENLARKQASGLWLAPAR